MSAAIRRKMEACEALFDSPNPGEAAAARAAWERLSKVAGLSGRAGASPADEESYAARESLLFSAAKWLNDERQIWVDRLVGLDDSFLITTRESCEPCSGKELLEFALAQGFEPFGIEG